MPSMVDWPRPSMRDCAKAASRFGPTTPVALARARLWHCAHSWVNFCLPLSRFAWGSLPAQPATANAAATPAMTTLPLIMGGILTGGADERAVDLHKGSDPLSTLQVA